MPMPQSAASITTATETRAHHERQHAPQRSGNRSRKITIWTQDFHIAPVRDLKHFFADIMRLDVHWLDFSHSGHCHLVNTCRGGQLKLPAGANWWDQGANKYEARRIFFETYRVEMQNVDLFVCSFPMANCEWFLGFDRPMIVIHTVPAEISRQGGLFEMKEWLELQVKMSKDDMSAVVANNVYHQQYLKHFLNIDVPWIQSFCGYVRSAASPPYQAMKKNKIFLIGGNHDAPGLDAILATTRQHVSAASGITIQAVKSLYNPYTFDQLLAHPGVIFVPYTVSVMTFFEYYRLAIPIFAPSLELLALLEATRSTTTERIYNGFEQPYGFLPHSPNALGDAHGTRFWLNFSDIFTFPHIIHFDSPEHLAQLLHQATDDSLAAVSRDMAAYNARQEQMQVRFWSDKLDAWGVFGDNRRAVPTNYAAEMIRRWSTLTLPNSPQCGAWPYTTCPGGRNPGLHGKC
jgi:hypothetical protein